MASSKMSKRTVVMVAVMATLLQQLQPSEAARKRAVASPLLRFPGLPGTRQRNPGFPGFPGARPSAPMAGFPGLPDTQPSPPSVPGLPGLPLPPPMPSPGSQAPCARPAEPLPGFPGLPGGSSGGSSSSSSSSPTDCVTTLAGLMTCASFLTGSVPETPTPQSECCSGLGMFLNSSAAEGGSDRSLRCLCPVILGDVNRMLPKPIDPVRMMYLPIACGVVLPPQVLFICFTGQPTPPVVTRIPDSWATPSSAFSP